MSILFLGEMVLLEYGGLAYYFASGFSTSKEIVLPALYQLVDEIHMLGTDFPSVGGYLYKMDALLLLSLWKQGLGKIIVFNAVLIRTPK